MIIRKATTYDQEAVRLLIRDVCKITTPSPFQTEEEMIGFWLQPLTICYVAEEDGKISGSFIIRENHPELGAHIAHASYLVAPNHLNQGIEYKMSVFSLSVARDLGFLSIQFDLIIDPEKHDLPLWEELGFKVIGELENASIPKGKSNIRTFILARKL